MNPTRQAILDALEGTDVQISFQSYFEDLSGRPIHFHAFPGGPVEALSDDDVRIEGEGADRRLVFGNQSVLVEGIEGWYEHGLSDHGTLDVTNSREGGGQVFLVLPEDDEDEDEEDPATDAMLSAAYLILG